MLKVDIHGGTIGPTHDPYSTETVILKTADGRQVVHYSDALGSVRVTCTGDDNSNITLYESRNGNEPEVRKHAEAVFAEVGGVPLDLCYELFNRQFDDVPF